LKRTSVRDEIRALAEKSWTSIPGRAAARGLDAGRRRGRQRLRFPEYRANGCSANGRCAKSSMHNRMPSMRESIMCWRSRDLVVSSFTVAQATGRLSLEELDRLDLTARQDSVFAIDRNKLSLKLWPRTKKGESI